MPNEGPLRCSEKRMRLDIGRTSTGSESAVLILDKQLADERLAKTGRKKKEWLVSEEGTIMGKRLSLALPLGVGKLTWKSAEHPRGRGMECPPAGCWQTSRYGSYP